MTTTCEALCVVAKTKPKAGEDFEDFAKRLTDKINSVTDPEWQSLGDGSAAQTWHNDTMTAFDKRRVAKAEAREKGEDEDEAVAAISLPELEGYEAVPAKGDEPEKKTKAKGEESEPASDAEEVDPDTGEVSEKKAAKAKKEKPAKVAKEKKEKPTKEAKAPKAPKEKKVAKPAKAKSSETRGRRSLFADTDKVKLLIKTNPHREGTTRFKNYAKLKDGHTVADNVKGGVSRQQIWSMMSREIIYVG